ncbi:MAG: hypothetical protein HYY04_16860 [Chloroflexi bacterium]|nr:hypothetical protein [Chloroflexota bacterium]
MTIDLTTILFFDASCLIAAAGSPTGGSGFLLSLGGAGASARRDLATSAPGGGAARLGLTPKDRIIFEQEGEGARLKKAPW